MILKPRLGRKPRRVKAKNIPLPVFMGLFNEGSGNIVSDLSGNGNTGSLVGDTHFVGGKFGHALDFDGTGDYVNCGDTSFLSNTQGAISIWVYIDTLVNAGKLVGHGGDTTGTIFGLEIREDTNWYFSVIQRLGGGDLSAFRGNTIITAGRWYHVVLTSDGTVWKIYIDAVDEGTLTALPFNSGTNNGDWFGDSTNANQTFGIAALEFENVWAGEVDCQIDNVIVFDQYFTASQVVELNRNPSPWFERDPTELWAAATAGAAPSVTIPIMIHHYKQAGGL